MSDQSHKTIVAAFDAAADSYDAASNVQRDIARQLVARAAQSLVAPPKTILDLGSGAGHVTGAALKLWPDAEIMALDAAPAMLAALRAKYPGVKTLRRDAAALGVLGRFDLILSSMMLHWLPDPRAALTQWREKLNPGGKLHVAVPVEGSLSEWREFLRAAGLPDGLWTFPPPGLGRDIAANAETIAFAASYPDARAFLQSLKRTGAHRARAGYRPTSPAALRRLLAARQGEFTATFQILFLTVEASMTVPAFRP
jgi:malonyl-CoA O-methyltransferase